MAQALTFAHSKGVCHQDLKPSNILMTFEHDPLLLDFNLSNDGRPIDRIGGTLPYMAPEQIGAMIEWKPGAATEVDPRTDIFSWGVVMLESLSNAPPFRLVPPDHPDLWEELLETRRETPRTECLAGRVDRKVIELLQSCIAFDVRDRPESAQVLIESLERLIEPRPRAGASDRPSKMAATGTSDLRGGKSVRRIDRRFESLSTQ